MKFKFKDATVRRMKLSDLKPAEYNPRSISDKAFDGLGKSMDRFGLLMPIVWNEKTGNIVGGHQRFRHLVATGETETDVVVVSLDDNEEVSLNIVLNSKELRGDYTEDVVTQLRLAEVRMGDAFKDVGLATLFEQMQKLYPTSEKKDWRPSDDTPPGPRPDRGDSPAASGDGGGVEAIIKCPKCHSEWEMKTKRVVFNSTKESGNADGQELEG